MAQTLQTRTFSAFSLWRRTGRLPRPVDPEGTELKFNPWHDPADGRFTFVGSGQYHGGGGGSGSTDRRSGVASRSAKANAPLARNKPMSWPRISPSPQPALAQSVPKVLRSTTPRKPPPTAPKPNAAAEFVGGVGEGLYGVVKDAAEGTYAALTTNPITTARNAGLAIAGMIDAAISAENSQRASRFRALPMQPLMRQPATLAASPVRPSPAARWRARRGWQLASCRPCDVFARCRLGPAMIRRKSAGSRKL